jgi:hypothetical protein
MEDRERMAAEAVAIYEELFETFKGASQAIQSGRRVGCTS